MTTRLLNDHKANLIGSLWMVAAMAGFAVEDMFLKSAAATVPIGQVMIWFGLGGSLIFAVIAVSLGQSLFPHAVVERTMIVRNAFEIMGRLFFTLAIVLTPLSSATAILQATPIVVAMDFRTVARLFARRRKSRSANPSHAGCSAARRSNAARSLGLGNPLPADPDFLQTAVASARRPS